MTATPQTPYPRVTLRYCTRCNWLLRAAWLAQELLQTFNIDLGEVVLQPGDGGIFQIHVETENGHRELIWCRATGAACTAAAANNSNRLIRWRSRVIGRYVPDHSPGQSGRVAVALMFWLPEIPVRLPGTR